MRDYPEGSSRGKKGKQVVPNVPKDNAPNKWRFYALRTRGEKPDGGDDDEVSPCFPLLVM